MPESAVDFNPPHHNQPEYSVSEISGALKRVVEDNFGHVRVRGEISGWKGAHSSGHAYFRLKDAGAVLEAVCWRGTLAKLQCRPEEGLEVICTGRITTYPGRSNYQIVVEAMEPAGAGALMALLEKRKKMLEAEGLFRAERKKPLPFLPGVIGVVTSPTGAVIRDILHRIRDRFPLHVLVWPVPVQGEGAAERIAEAIAGFNALGAGGFPPRPDVLIVARGGGSLEDLWAFNEEIVVRAAAASAIPLISAVGHETDTTLIDLAADRRAPTPTAAAEMAVPVLADLKLVSMDLEKRLYVAVQRALTHRAEVLVGLARGLPRPARLLEQAWQRLDDWSDRLRAALPGLLEARRQRLLVALAGLRPQALERDVAARMQRLEELSGRLNAAAMRVLAEHERRLAALSALHASLDYRRVLARGFALARDAGGRVIASAEKARKERALVLEFRDGLASVTPSDRDP